MTKRLLHVRRWRPGLLAALAATWRRAVHDQLRAWVGGRVAAGRAGPAPSLPGGPGGSEDRRLAQDASEAAALRRLAELKDELMRTVSHELRTPLSYIYGYSELLSVSTALPERERKMAVEIHRAAEHMRRLIDDLLDLGQIESGDVPLDLMPADVGDSIEQAIQDVQAIEGSTHRFTVEVAPDLPAAIADPSRLQQVLMHLLTNAVRYSPRESEVRAGAHLRYDVRGPKSQVQGHTGGMLPQDMGPSDVGLASDAGAGQGQLVEVWVADQGAGLTPEQRERIFEKFYRGDVSLTGRHPGVGLGLAIARGLVEAHGGRIWAESAGPERGTTFHFTLPVAPRGEAASPQRSAVCTG